MKPTTRQNIERRLELLEGNARAKQSARQVETGSRTRLEEVARFVLDESLSIEEVVEQINATGGRGDARGVSRMRELFDLARLRQMQGVQFT